MKNKIHLPPISPLCDYYSNNPGSLDFTALNNQLPNKMSQSSAYEEISNLSSIIDSLQKENQLLTQKIRGSTANNNSQNSLSAALILEQKLQKFMERLKERDKELNEISKCLTINPNFINLKNQTRKQNEKASAFDMFKSSLLISNDQKKFFKAPELERQNQELREIIQRQEEQIRIVKARQSIYQQLQQNNSISTKLDQLNKSPKTPKFVYDVLDQTQEQDLTIQMLQSELISLINTRKLMVEKRKDDKLNLRKYRLQYKSALTIQRVVKGFITRMRYKRQKKSAILIQKVIRGFLVRRHINLNRKK